MKRFALLLFLLPNIAFAGSLTVETPIVPLAPPTAKVHAAYMELTNDSAKDVELVGIEAEGYAMAHLHKSEVVDGVATMSAVHMLKVAAGRTVALEQGGLHIMLMQPQAPKVEGDTVAIELQYSDGTSQTVIAIVTKGMSTKGHAHMDHAS